MAEPRPPIPPGTRTTRPARLLRLKSKRFSSCRLTSSGSRNREAKPSVLEERFEAVAVQVLERADHAVSDRELLRGIAVGHGHDLHPRPFRGQDPGHGV